MKTVRAAGLCGWSIAVLLACSARVGDPQPPGAHLRVGSVLAPIGAPVEIEVSVLGPAGGRPDLSFLPASLEVREPLSDLSAGQQTRWRFSLTSFVPGTVTVPPIPIVADAATAGSGAPLKTGETSLRFLAPDVTANDRVRPLSGRLDAPRTVPLAPLVAGAAALALAVWGGVRTVRWSGRVRRRHLLRRKLLLRLVEIGAQVRAEQSEGARALGHVAVATLRELSLSGSESSRPEPGGSAPARAPRETAAVTAAILELDRQRFAKVPDADIVVQVISRLLASVATNRRARGLRGVS